MTNIAAEISLSTFILVGWMAALLLTIQALCFLIDEAWKFLKKMKRWK